MQPRLSLHLHKAFNGVSVVGSVLGVCKYLTCEAHCQSFGLFSPFLFLFKLSFGIVFWNCLLELFFKSFCRQAEVLSSCMPGHSAQRLIAQEPLLLVVDVIEVLGHIQLALPWSNPVTVLARWPELARWDCRDIVRRLATWV